MNLRTIAHRPLLLASDLRSVRQRPVLVAGMPRSGSSWTGAILATGKSIRYYREPFNAKWRRYAEPFQFRYLRSGDEDNSFDEYCRAAFDGRIGGPAVEKHHWERYKRYRGWPGRALLKEVHAILALDRIDDLVHPAVAVIVRHPCALAASWARLDRDRPGDPMWSGVDDHLSGLLSQNALLEDYLSPYADVLSSADSYYEKVGALWGAIYTVLLSQAKTHSDWAVVTHEALSLNPEAEFQALFAALGCKWTPATTQALARTTSADGKKPYGTVRVSTDEPDKWRSELTSDQVDQVWLGAAPFGIDLYSDPENEKG